MNKFIKIHTRILLCGIFSLMLLVGCGSGGGGGGGGGGGDAGTGTGSPNPPKIVTGTAAAGLPISGIVNALGSAGGTAQATIQTDGTYTIDVTALTAPYILFAEGMAGNVAVKYYAAALAQGNLNITPITDLILRYALAGGALTDPAQVTQAALDFAQALVQAQLLPVLNATGTQNFSLLTDVFSVGQPGMDALLNALTFAIYSSITNSIQVTNNYTGSSYQANVANSSAVVGLPTTDEAITRQVVSDNVAINQLWDNVEALYATSQPSAGQINSTIGPIFANDFLNAGGNKTQTLTDWGLGQAGTGPFVGIVLHSTIGEVISPAPAGYQKAYWVNLHYSSSTATYSTGSFRYIMVYDGTNWLVYGDQKWVKYDHFLPWMTSGYTGAGSSRWFATGLFISMYDQFGFLQTKGVQSGLVKGPGLPAEGVVLTYAAPVLQNMIQSPFYMMTDANIASIPDNAVYIVGFYSQTFDVLSASPAAYSPIHTYSHTIAKPPVPPSVLDATMFPTLISPSSQTLASGDIPGVMNVAWTNPTKANVVDLRLSWSSVGQFVVNSVEKYVPVGSTSTSLDSTSFQVLGGVAFADLTLGAADAFNRRFLMGWDLSPVAVPEPPVGGGPAGIWNITETNLSNNCGDPIGVVTAQYQVTVVQNGGNITVTTPVGLFQGLIVNNTLSWSGSFPDGGGTSTINALEVDITGDTFGGLSSWTWSDGIDTCSGFETVTGTRQVL